MTKADPTPAPREELTERLENVDESTTITPLQRAKDDVILNAAALEEGGSILLITVGPKGTDEVTPCHYIVQGDLDYITAGFLAAMKDDYILCHMIVGLAEEAAKCIAAVQATDKDPG